MAKRVIVILLILAVPFLLAARGNKEAGNGQGILLEEEFSDLLTQLENGEITKDELIDELALMQNRFELRNEERKALENLVEAVAAGELTAAQACDGIPDQLRDRDRLQDDGPDRDRLRDKDQDPQLDQDRDRDKDQDQLIDQDRDRDKDGDCDQDPDCEPDQTQDQLRDGENAGGNSRS